MDFKQLQDAVIADLFDETDRGDVKNWINARGRMLWGIDEWSFRRAETLVGITVGTNTITNVPLDFDEMVDLFRDDGTKLAMYEEFREFASLYLGTDNSRTGLPEACSVMWHPQNFNDPEQPNGDIWVGPIANTTSSTYLLVYERAWTTLVADGDIPQFPSDTHLALVFGAKADGMVLKSILLNEPLEQRYQEYVTSMQRDFITQVRGATHQTPAYRPGGGYSGRWLTP